MTGPNLYNPTPTPENTLIGVGGGVLKKRRGAHKISAAGGASKYALPPPCVGQAWGEEGGVYMTFPWKICSYNVSHYFNVSGAFPTWS